MPNMSTGTLTTTGTSGAVTLTFSKPDSNFSFTFSGTFTGATLKVEGKDSSGNWEPLACKDMGLGTVNVGGTAFALTNSTNKAVAGDCGMFKAVRVYASALSTGSVSVLAQSDNFGAGQIVPSFLQATTGSAITAPAVVTGTNADAFDVGQNGSTNPALQIDTSTSSSATGVKITSAAAAGGVAVAAISSGTDEALTIDAKGSGTITLAGTSTGAVLVNQNLTMANAKNIVLNTSTGTKIGTGTTQKLAFFNSTPVAQPSTSGTLIGFNGNGATNANAVNFNANGNSGSTFYNLGDIVFNLKSLGLLAA